MNKAMIAVLAMTMGLAAMPAGAVENQHPVAKKAAKTGKMESLGGGSACKSGKGMKGGMEGCCCSGMMAKKMDMMGGHGDMDMSHDGHEGMDHDAMMERMRKMEERMEMMQKMMEQKSRG